MAITINTTPELYTLGGNPVEFNISSTNSSQPNFKYIVDLYDSTAVLQTRIKLNKDIDNTATVDVGRLLNSLLAANIVTFGDGETECPKLTESGVVQYSIDFGEEYGSTPVIYSSLTNSGTKYVIYGGLNPLEFNNFLYTNYALDTSTRLFLKKTNYGRSSSGPIIIRSGEWDLASYLVLSHNQAYRMRVITTDTLGSQTSSNFLLAYATISSNIRKIQTIPTGFNINNLTGFGVTQPIISATDTVSYTVQIFDNASVASSEMLYFKVDSSCSKGDEYRFQWLNELGGYDGFTFKAANRPKLDIERKTYKIDATLTNSFTANIDYYNRIQDKITVQSDWLTNDQAEYLSGLLSSPQIYHLYQDGSVDGIYRRMRITDTSYEIKKVENDKLFNLTLTLQPSYTHTRLL